MTSFCHGPLAIGNKEIGRKGVIDLEEIREAVKRYRDSNGEDTEALIQITELAAKYSIDIASTYKLAAMLNEESVKANQ